MRRLFIIRKDLNLSPGKLAAMVGHLAEAYWTNMLKSYAKEEFTMAEYDPETKDITVKVPFDIWKDYVNKIFTKTICECKNLTHLKNVEKLVEDLNVELESRHMKRLVLGIDYGYINDSCKTELTPENPNGTTTIGIWFRPMPDDIIQRISKKYKLYGAFDKDKSEIKYYSVTLDSYGGMHNSSYECYGKYHTYAEAKKHFDYLVENNVKSNEVFCEHISCLTNDQCKYSDGLGQSYKLAINKVTVNGIKDKFVEQDGIKDKFVEQV